MSSPHKSPSCSKVLRDVLVVWFQGGDGSRIKKRSVLALSVIIALLLLSALVVFYGGGKSLIPAPWNQYFEFLDVVSQNPIALALAIVLGMISIGFCALSTAEMTGILHSGDEDSIMGKLEVLEKKLDYVSSNMIQNKGDVELISLPKKNQYQIRKKSEKDGK